MRVLYKHMAVAAVTIASSVSGIFLDAQTLPSLMLGQDPAAVAMGMAGVASDPGAYALQNNVASVSLARNSFDGQIGIGIWQPDYAGLKSVDAGAMYKLGKFGLALEMKMLQMPSYSGVSGSGSEIRDSGFTPSEMNIAAGVSYAFMDFLSAGVTLRYAGSKLAPEASAAIFGADMAVFFKKDGIRAGLSVNNLGTKVKYVENAYPQPMMAKAGAGYDLELGKSELDFSAELDVLFSGSIMAGAGCEYSFNDLVHVRAGYHYGSAVDAVPSYASAGLGLSVFGVRLDFAYLFGSEVLRNSMCLSLGYSF